MRGYSHNRIRAAYATLLTLLITVSSTAPVHATPLCSYTISPLTSTYGSNQAFEFVINNDGTEDLNYVEIQVPTLDFDLFDYLPSPGWGVVSSVAGTVGFEKSSPNQQITPTNSRAFSMTYALNQTTEQLQQEFSVRASTSQSDPTATCSSSDRVDVIAPITPPPPPTPDSPPGAGEMVDIRYVHQLAIKAVALGLAIGASYILIRPFSWSKTNE